MPLLPDDLRSRLPPFFSQKDADPMVYIRFYLPGTQRSWYVIEGQPENADFVFFGFVSGHNAKFGHFRLSELEAVRGQFGESVERDLTFAEGRLTDVVPAPDA
jgi:hypothetical protein